MGVVVFFLEFWLRILHHYGKESNDLVKMDVMAATEVGNEINGDH